MKTKRGLKNTIQNAKWIWCDKQNPFAYNIASEFKKDFEAKDKSDAMLHITCDSFYRVWINGKWLNDGPGKAYPEHFVYDSYDVSQLLRRGPNIISIVGRYYGIGTFHQLPQQAGLLAEIALPDQVIGSDESWLSRPATWLRQQTPKVSCQMEPCEVIEASKLDVEEWELSTIVAEVERAPWRDLCSLRKAELPKQSYQPKRVHSECLVKRNKPSVAVPVTRITHPNVIECNRRTSRPVVLAVCMTVEDELVMDGSSSDWVVAIDGTRASDGQKVESGKHAVLFCCSSFFGHQKELAFPFINLPGVVWGEWSVIICEEFLYKDTDVVWLESDHQEADCLHKAWLAEIEKICTSWTSCATPVPKIGKKLDVGINELFLEDYSFDFLNRKVLLPSRPNASNSSGVCVDKSGVVHIVSCNEGDVEICYDFGVQQCGYLSFKIIAPERVEIDFNLVEHITRDGTVQHTAELNRNGMRYRTKEGENSWVSYKKRSGRYLFVTFRYLQQWLQLEELAIIDSTTEVQPVERFDCSDLDLVRVWDACERTLRMGMEDTFTDCSLYEQTLWVGDARNQASYAFNIYGAPHVSKRSLQLGADSLERFPIVGCQVPSTWECILPAWSFLWGCHVWEHYFYTGDQDFLSSIWHSVMTNLRNAVGFRDQNGLFSCKFWNLFEWSPVDDSHHTVIHNSLLLLMALKAAQKCCHVVGSDSEMRWLLSHANEFSEALDRWWDNERGYPDSIDDDGLASTSFCQHNHALAILAGVLSKKRLDFAKNSLLNPPPDLIKIHSPFAAQFLFEALDAMGEQAAIISEIRRNYLPMIEEGATTVWETFPNSTCSPSGFPTRSHCHGWSCAPLQFYNRIVLGIRQTKPGGTAFEVSPWVDGLTRASGAMWTAHGPLHVDWRKTDSQLDVIIVSPKEAKCEWITVSTQVELKVNVNITYQ